MKKLEDYITTIPDFPEKGVLFRDITSVIENVDGFRLSINELMELLSNVEFDKLVTLESRGFIFGAPIAYEMEKPMVLVRKKGKLPRETISQDYGLEYGNATIEIHKHSINPGDRVVLLDDLIATGGTLEAAGKLVEKLGGQVVKVVALVELRGFNARARLNYDVASVLSYEGK
jgi:adenine phosphoribosyltransferase